MMELPLILSLGQATTLFEVEEQDRELRHPQRLTFHRGNDKASSIIPYSIHLSMNKKSSISVCAMNKNVGVWQYKTI